MSKQVTCIIILLIFLVFLTKFGKKKGFNWLESYWIGFTLLFYIVFDAMSTSNKMFLLLLFANIKVFYVPIITVTGVIVAIIGNKFKTYRATALNLYKNYLNLKIDEKKLSKKPTIYVANYPSNYIEYLTHGLFCDKLCVVVHGPALKILKYIYGEKHIIPVEKGSYEKVQEKIVTKISEGYSIFSYVERDYYNRKSDYDVCELRSGMFSISRELNVTLTPVCIDHIHHIMGIIDYECHFNVKIGDSFVVKDVKDDMNKVKLFFEKELRIMKIPKSKITK